MATPIILLSVKADAGFEREQAWQATSTYIYLSKPCLIADLQAAVEKLLHIQVFEA
jgi:hypothetical protein